MASESKNGLVGTLEDLFKKAPALPASARETIVNITPWIALVFGVIGVLALFSLLGLATVLSPLAMYGGAYGVAGYGQSLIAGWISFGSSVLLLMAFPGTKARKMSGWNLLFWSEVVSVVSSVVSYNVTGAVLGALIGFYLLFQIKSYYK